MATKLWDQGYETGRTGGLKTSLGPIYGLGYIMGESALEAAENGSPW